MDQHPFTNQELLDYGLFYSRKEKELQDKLEKLLESIDEDSDEDVLLEDPEDEDFNEADSLV